MRVVIICRRKDEEEKGYENSEKVRQKSCSYIGNKRKERKRRKRELKGVWEYKETREEKQN